jgi:hypothetical protein
LDTVTGVERTVVQEVDRDVTAAVVGARQGGNGPPREVGPVDGERDVHG